MNQSTLKELEKVIHRDYNNITGIVVQTDGTIRYENYFNGFQANHSAHLYSVTKSVVSALIGIAVDLGFIDRIDRKVLDFFPDYTVKTGEQTIQNITIEHLLTMTAPYQFEADPFQEYFTSDDWISFSLDLLGGQKPIGEFRYTPLIGPDILSGILVRATGRSVLDFADEYLFSPLGIHVPQHLILNSEEEQAAIMNDKHTTGWVADSKGINAAGWGLFLTPAEMAKIGQLYLNGGLWDGRQVVSAKWIDDSTKEHASWNGLSYGCLWWVIDDRHIYAALGDGGNVIYVNVEMQMVVSIASLFMPDAKDRIEFIKTWIEPVFAI